MTSSPATYNTEWITDVKYFIVLTPGGKTESPPSLKGRHNIQHNDPQEMNNKNIDAQHYHCVGVYREY